MKIQVVIGYEIVKEVDVNLEALPYKSFTPEHFEKRQEFITAYLHELRSMFPKASFQLAFESRAHLINQEDY